MLGENRGWQVSKDRKIEGAALGTFRGDSRMQVSVFAEKDLRLRWSQSLDSFKAARD